MFELASMAVALEGDIAPSVAAITEDESPLSHLTARAGSAVVHFMTLLLCDKHSRHPRLPRVRHGLQFTSMR